MLSLNREDSQTRGLEKAFIKERNVIWKEQAERAGHRTLGEPCFKVLLIIFYTNNVHPSAYVYSISNRTVSDNFNDVTHQRPRRSPVINPRASLTLSVTSELCSEHNMIQTADQLSHRAHIKEKVSPTTALSFTFLCFTAGSQTGVTCSCRHFNELQ